MDDVFVESRQIPSAHLWSICKYRHGPATCKYICFYKDSFYCVKNVENVKSQIDAQKKMKAKADNCKGL